MKLLINDPAVGEFVEQHAGALYTRHADVTFGTEIDGKIAGGVILTNFTGAACQSHVAGVHPRWLSRDLLWITFHYVFVQLGLKQVLVTLNAANETARRFNERLGYETVCSLKDVFPDSDMLVMSLRRDQGRFLDIQPRTVRAGGFHGR